MPEIVGSLRTDSSNIARQIDYASRGRAADNDNVRGDAIETDPSQDGQSTWGVAVLPTSPVLSRPENGADLNTEVLFGEAFRVLETSKRSSWTLIQLVANGEKGWIDVPFEPMGTDQFLAYQAVGQSLLNQPIGLLNSSSGPGVIYLGSAVPKLDEGATSFRIGTRNFEIHSPDPQFLDPSSEVGTRRLFVETALKFHNTGYRWGGRTISAGVDCSGLVVVAGRFVGVELPHSARKMATLLETVDSLGSARSGDLLFYQKESEARVRHVGILLSYAGGQKREILHQSGTLTIDTLDEHGSYGSKSLKLQGIARVV